MDLYLDESGNLGFMNRSDPYYVIAFLATNESNRLKSQVKRIRRKYQIGTALKGYKCTATTREDFLAGLINIDLEIHYIALNKNKVKPRLAARQNILFNYAAGLLLIPFITKRGGKIALIIDKQTAHVTSGFRIKDFLEYKIWYEAGRPDIDLAIQLLDLRMKPLTAYKP